MNNIIGLKPSQPFTLCEPITVDLRIAATEAFLSLERTINEHVLKESDFDHRPAQDLCCVSRDRDSKSEEGETPQESKGEKLSLESSFPGSPPKCSTPRMTKPAKFEIRLDHLDTSSSSSCDDSSQKVQTKGGSCNGKCRICMFREGRNLLLHKAACFSVRKRSMGSMGRSSFGMCLVK